MRMQPIKIIATLILLTFVGCATMIRGTHESLQLSSNPEGALAQLSDGESCTTPCAINLARDTSVSVNFTKDGCDNQVVSVFPSLAGAGVILGGVIDYGTGAVYNLQPNPVVAGLHCHAVAETVGTPVASAPTSGAAPAPVAAPAAAISSSAALSPPATTAAASASGASQPVIK